MKALYLLFFFCCLYLLFCCYVPLSFPLLYYYRFSFSVSVFCVHQIYLVCTVMYIIQSVLSCLVFWCIVSFVYVYTVIRRVFCCVCNVSFILLFYISVFKFLRLSHLVCSGLPRVVPFCIYRFICFICQSYCLVAMYRTPDHLIYRMSLVVFSIVVCPL
jgi:hypothetical protein